MIPPKILDAVSPEMFTHLEASTNYTILHQNSGKKLISGYSLKVFAKLFQDKHFIRVDRSNLVNRSFISGISERQKGVYVVLKNNTELLIPRRRQTLLFCKHPNLFNSNLNLAYL
jgi:DNA-binding LytR/AlgR family response regulator